MRIGETNDETIDCTLRFIRSLLNEVHKWIKIIMYLQMEHNILIFGWLIFILNWWEHQWDASPDYLGWLQGVEWIWTSKACIAVSGMFYNVHAIFSALIWELRSLYPTTLIHISDHSWDLNFECYWKHLKNKSTIGIWILQLVRYLNGRKEFRFQIVQHPDAIWILDSVVTQLVTEKFAVKLFMLTF